MCIYVTVAANVMFTSLSSVYFPPLKGKQSKLMTSPCSLCFLISIFLTSGPIFTKFGMNIMPFGDSKHVISNLL